MSNEGNEGKRHESLAIPEPHTEAQPSGVSAAEEAERLYQGFLREVAEGADANEVYRKIVGETTSDESFDLINERIDVYNEAAKAANGDGEHQEQVQLEASPEPPQAEGQENTGEALPLDPHELIHAEPSGRVGPTPFWIGHDGAAYVSMDDQPVRVGDRGPWDFERRDGKGRLRSEKKYWDGTEQRFVDVRPPERRNQPEPERRVEEPPARAERVERLQRPDREPDGEFDDRDYWVEPDGSAIIEDDRNHRKVYRVEPGGLHWVAQRDPENRKENQRDVEGLEWNGADWRLVKRSEWGSEGVRAETPAQEAQPRAAPAPVPAAPAQPSRFSPEDPTARVEAVVKSISPEFAAALVEPKIGSEPETTVVAAEKDRVAGAFRQLASQDPASFDKARRALTAFSEYSRGAYKRVENEVDEFARRERLPHGEFARILHEPDQNARFELTKTQVARGLGFFGGIWNRCTFGLFASTRARRIELSSLPLMSRMRATEAELEKRRGTLRTLLGIS